MGSGSLPQAFLTYRNPYRKSINSKIALPCTLGRIRVALEGINYGKK
jgi:hypothetical protein